jgi:hypothetical protein
MQPHQLRKPRSFLKQDIVALVAIAIYVALAFLVVEGWGSLSEEANAFVSNVKRITTVTAAHTVGSPAPAANEASSPDSKAIVTAPDQNSRPEEHGIMACARAIASNCDEIKRMLPE